MADAQWAWRIRMKVHEIGRQIGKTLLAVEKILEGVQRIQGEQHSRQTIGGG